MHFHPVDFFRSPCAILGVIASVIACKGPSVESRPTNEVSTSPTLTESAFAAKPSTEAPAPTISAPVTASAGPNVTPPQLSPRVARVCDELALTQRRIFAAAWSEQEAPEIVPEPEPDVVPPPTTAPATPSSTLPTIVVPSTAAPSTSASSAPVEAPDWSDLDKVTGVPPVPDPFGHCLPTHDGAWFVAFDEAGRDENEIKGRWSILHIDRAGKIDSVQPATQDYVAECQNERCTSSDSYELPIVGDQFVSTLNATVFDWNADGKDELFVHLYLAYLGGSSEGGHIWTYRKRTIELYRPARALRISRLSDIDLDGRPDVVLTLGSGVRMSPCTNRRAFTDTLELGGHALADGTFSFKDDVAIGFAKQKCAVPQPRLTTQVEAICARIWGQSSERVAAALERGCKALTDVCDTDCEDQDALSYVTHDLRIPVVIPATAR